MDRPAKDDAAEANRLYWSSNKGVNQIADDLGMSKGMLYAAIRPLPSEYACPLCQGELVYANRTALERQVLSCPECEHEFEERAAKLQRIATASDLEPLAAEGPRLRVDLKRARREEAAAPTVTPDTGTLPGTTPEPVAGSRQGTTRTLVGAAALCLGVGVMIGRYLERR
ncbi:MAG: hypothetical protein R3E10_16680 [Gemmatimonadota bacterium]